VELRKTAEHRTKNKQFQTQRRNIVKVMGQPPTMKIFRGNSWKVLCDAEN